MEPKVNGTVGRPGAGQVRVRQGAIALGVSGAPVAAGALDAVGDEAIGFVSGDRVAYWGGEASTAEVRLVDIENLIGVPSGVSDEQAAALLPSGLAARTLVKEVHAVGGNDTVVVHAAAGVLGSMTVAWAKALGATVIATVGNPAGREQALRSGADHVIVFGREDVAARVREITGGRGADVVYDGVGQATFDASLGSLRRGGALVLFGSHPPRIDEQAVEAKRVKIVRPQLDQHSRGGSIQQGAADLFLAIRSGLFDGIAVTSYPSTEVDRALADLEDRKIVGPVVLVPSRTRETVRLAA